MTFSSDINVSLRMSCDNFSNLFTSHLLTSLGENISTVFHQTLDEAMPPVNHIIPPMSVTSAHAKYPYEEPEISHQV